MVFTEILSSVTEAKQILERQLILPNNLSNLVNIYNGIMTHAHFIAQKTNGVAERTVHRVKERTSLELVQRRLPEEWWCCAMECGCYLRNEHDNMADGKTAFDNKFSQTHGGPSMLFGTLVEHIPITAKGHVEYNNFGKTKLK